MSRDTVERALRASFNQRFTSVDVKGMPDGIGEVNCSIVPHETAVKLSHQPPGKRVSEREQKT